MTTKDTNKRRDLVLVALITFLATRATDSFLDERNALLGSFKEQETETRKAKTVKKPTTLLEDEKLRDRMANIQYFFETVNQTASDKVTIHTYQNMYGTFLLPYYYHHPNMKMLEIGLGCDSDYGAGHSVAAWKALVPEAELWMAEFNGKCVEKHKANLTKQGVHDVLVGDQGNPQILQQWIKQSNATNNQFDIIIDDGGHKNCQIKTSFDALWPTVKPGGLYFIEDLQVGRWKHYRCGNDQVMSDVIQEWIEGLLIDGKLSLAPTDASFVMCQAEACVVGKKTNDEGLKSLKNPFYFGPRAK